MINDRKKRLNPWHRALLVALAISIGPIVILSFIGMMSLYSGRTPDISDEMAILYINAGMISFPFVVIALLGTTKRMPWLIGIGLTAAMWGYFFYDTLFRPSSGVNIGLGLLLLASPIFITIACLAAAWQSESANT